MEQAAKAGLQGKGEIWDYDPTLREKAGAPVTGDYRPYGLRAETASVADLTPVLGGVFSSQEAWRAFEARHYGEAALDSLGVVPTAGIGGKVGKKVVGEVAENIFGRAAREVGSLTKPAEEFASRSANIYDPQTKPARSILDDYPYAVIADDNEKLLIDTRTGGQLSDPETGRLLYDPEGRTLGERVVGRRVVGGEDVAVLSEEHDALAEAAIGSRITADEARAFSRGEVGKYIVGRGPEGPERSIHILNTLRASDAIKVGAHEIGHMIDDLAGKIVGHDRAGPVRMIDQDGIKAELKWLYNDLNNPVLQRARAANERPLTFDEIESSVMQNYTPEGAALRIELGLPRGYASEEERMLAEVGDGYMTPAQRKRLRYLRKHSEKG